MKIAIGNDHAGVEMKNQIADWLREQGCEIINVGNDEPEDRQDDYPIYGYKVARLVKDGEAELGICICGTGVGISLHREFEVPTPRVWVSLTEQAGLSVRAAILPAGVGALPCTRV